MKLPDVILPDVREAALDQVTRALGEKLGDRWPLLKQLAENLIAIAISNHVRIELLLEWIGFEAPRKQWSAAEWRRWCEGYRHALLDAETPATVDTEPALGLPFSASARD